MFLGAGGADSDSPPTTVVYELDAEGRAERRFEVAGGVTQSFRVR